MLNFLEGFLIAAGIYKWAEVLIEMSEYYWRGEFD